MALQYNIVVLLRGTSKTRHIQYRSACISLKGNKFRREQVQKGTSLKGTSLKGNKLKMEQA
jgi:hypothetical protein